MRWLVLVTLAACSANDDVPAPRIASITPDHAPVGAVVMIAGDFFCAQPEEDEESDPLACDVIGVVNFGATSSEASAYSDELINVEVPEAMRERTMVSVTVAGRVSNHIEFTVE
jgi:hypothetical protein